MTVVPFPARPDPPIRFRCVLTKGIHTRLFEIIPHAGRAGCYQTWMRHDGHPLRALLTDDPLIVATVRAEYEREIAALKADGWIDG